MVVNTLLKILGATVIIYTTGMSLAWIKMHQPVGPEYEIQRNAVASDMGVAPLDIDAAVNNTVGYLVLCWPLPTAARMMWNLSSTEIKISCTRGHRFREVVNHLRNN